MRINPTARLLISLSPSVGVCQIPLSLATNGKTLFHLTYNFSLQQYQYYARVISLFRWGNKTHEANELRRRKKVTVLSRKLLIATDQATDFAHHVAYEHAWRGRARVKTYIYEPAINRICNSASQNSENNVTVMAICMMGWLCLGYTVDVQPVTLL